MNTLLASVSQSLEQSDINKEVAALRQQANERIRMREVAREFVNRNLFGMPEIVKGTYTVKFKDGRDEEMAKEQAKNHALWLIALQTTIEVGYTTYELLGNIFSQWAAETLRCEWAVDDAVKTAAKYVESMRELGYLKAKKESVQFEGTNGTYTSSVNKLSETMLVNLEEIRLEMCDKSHMVCQPLRNQPEDWVDANTGIGEMAGMKLIKGKVVKSNRVAHKVLNAVNKLQRVPFVVHPAMIDTAYMIVDNARAEKCTVEELRMFNEIKQYEKGEFYFPVTMDTRGRMYYRGGLLSPQGTDFCKASFQFARYKALGDTGCDALCIHTANMLGMDKLSINKRIDTVYELVDSGAFDTIETVHDVQKSWPGASRFQALVAILEIKKVVAWELAGNEAEDFMSNLVCHQDGTCNGLQHMAAITKDLETAKTVNCTPATQDDEPLDIYQIIADEAVQHLTGAPKDLVIKYGRDMSKNPVMITGYGAGEETVIRNTGKFLAERGENSAHAEAIAKAYIRALNEKAGAVHTMTDAVKERMNLAISKGITDFQWETVDGFVAATNYRNAEQQRIRAGVFNALVYTDKELPMDDVKTVGAMCPNFVHSIDAAHLRMVINKCNHDLVTVHDSIGSHAATYDVTGAIVRETFVIAHKYGALANLFDKMGVRTPSFRGEFNIEGTLTARYLFS